MSGAVGRGKAKYAPRRIAVEWTLRGRFGRDYAGRRREQREVGSNGDG